MTSLKSSFPEARNLQRNIFLKHQVISITSLKLFVCCFSFAYCSLGRCPISDNKYYIYCLFIYMFRT
ncbi:hypothetical protein BDR04DRAFT_811830 [Suillus decipiens]|nr:hypothetical protein BDR04DRAFT_811830 [Suillus decipiens]